MLPPLCERRDGLADGLWHAVLGSAHRCNVEIESIFEALPSGATTSAPEPASTLPLAVDLDGTLIKTDLLLESVLLLLKRNPLLLFLLPVWLWQGKAYLKSQIASRVELDASVLPYRSDLLDYLKTEREAGRYLVLATAADARLARQVADYLGIFDLQFASDGVINLAGKSKRARLVSIFGANGFDYAARLGGLVFGPKCHRGQSRQAAERAHQAGGADRQSFSGAAPQVGPLPETTSFPPLVEKPFALPSPFCGGPIF